MKQKVKESQGRMRQYSLNLARYYRNPMTQVSLSLVLSLFIAAFFVLVAMRPTFVTIASLNTEIAESEKILHQLTTKALALQQAAQVWDGMQESVAVIEDSIPSDGPEYQSLTRVLEVIAVESDVGLASVSIGEGMLRSQILDPYSGRDRAVVPIDFTVRVSGDYPGVMAFFGNLIEIGRLVTIDSIAVTKETAQGLQESLIGMSITGTVQYLADPAQLVGVAVTKKGGR